MNILKRIGLALAGAVVPIATGLVKLLVTGDVISGVSAIAAGAGAVAIELLKDNATATARGLRPTAGMYVYAATRDFSVASLVVSSAALALCVAQGWGNAALYFLLGTLLFSGLDAVLFFRVHDLSGAAATLVPETVLTQSRAYLRIVQTTVQHVIGLTLFLHSVTAAVCYYGFWMVGGCDWLYYVLLRQTRVEGEMWWLSWTVPGWFGFRSWRSLRWASIIALAACAVALFWKGLPL